MDQLWTAVDVMAAIVACVFATKAWTSAHEARQDRLKVESLIAHQHGPPTPPFPRPTIRYRGEDEAADASSSVPDNGDTGPPTPKRT